MLKSFFSLFKRRAPVDTTATPDLSALTPAAIADLYEESYQKLHRYIDFALQELQQPRPRFAILQQNAAVIEAAHQTLIIYFTQYQRLLKELDRCGVQPRPLSPLALETLSKVKLLETSKSLRRVPSVSFDA